MPQTIRRLLGRSPRIEPPAPRLAGISTNRRVLKKLEANGSCLCGCGKKPRNGKYMPGHQTRRLWALVDKAMKGDKKAYRELEAEGWQRFLLFKQQAGH